jgi:hypothetical protein
MHIAGVLGVPTVAVFGSGIQQWFSPLGDGHNPLTGVETVSVAQLLDAVDATLRANRNSDREGAGLPDVSRNQSLR